MTTRFTLRLALAVFLGLASVGRADTTYLPGAAEVVGLAGARFSSTLEIANPGEAAATATIGLVAMEGRPAPAPVTRTLAAGESLRVEEALKALFSLGDGAAGTITVTSDAALLCSLTTRNVAAAEGAYGLGLLAATEGDLLGAGETGHAIWVSQAADASRGYRTNLSVTLVDAGTVVDVRVLGADGQVVGTATITADRPFVWQRSVASLVGAVDLPVARAEFAVKAGRATGYAVVNDNVTSDAIALQTERVASGATDRLVSGAALSPGLLGSYWVTDLRLYNPGAAPLEATVRAVGAPREASAVVPVPANGVVEVGRVLEALGLPERTACALRVTASAPLLVAARTNNLDPSGVRKGTFSAQQFVTAWPAGLLGAGSVGYFAGVDQTLNVPGVRTNLTVVGGPDGAAGELVLRDAAGAVQGRVPFRRGAGEWGQLGVADWFASAFRAALAADGLSLASIPANARIDVAVSAGSLDAFVSRIDNGSGDAVTRPVALPGGGDCSKVSITSFAAAPLPVRPGVETTFSWTVVLDPPTAHLTSQTIQLDGEPPVALDKDVRTWARTFATTGPRSVTLTVRKGSCVKTRTLPLFVCPDLTIQPAPLPDAVLGANYGVTLTSPGAAAPASFALLSGALPDGVTLSAAGQLAGAPSETSSFAFTVGVTDANGCTGSRALEIRVYCPPIGVLPSTLSPGTVGTSYGPVNFTPTGATGGGTWSSSGVPPGLSLSSGGTLSGTPTAAGTYAVAVSFRDVAGCEGGTTYTLVVCNPIAVTPGSVAAGTAGVALAPVTFNAAGAVGATTWAVTAGGLPAGVTLDAASGVLSGTPTVVGTFPFTVTATDSLGCTGSAALSLVVGCPTISILPASLANAVAGVAYVPVTLTQTGGVGAVTWTITAGNLPAGMTLAPATGVLSGTPTVTGTFGFTVTATDANGCIGTRVTSLTVDCPTITLAPPALANGIAGVAYGPVAVTQSGGVGAVTFSLLAGALPAGVTLSPAGVLSGTPLVVGTFGFTVRATDANGCTGDLALSLTIDCPTITVTPATVANGTAGVAYPGATFTQAGGVGTIGWTLASGVLPNGMSLDPSTGLLSGTPLQTGSFPITVRATDVNGCFGERVLTLTIDCPAIAVGPASIPGGTGGVLYPGATFTQAGGVGTITWSLAAGTLPNGMALDSGTGVLSGTPLQTGSFPITVRATDVNGCIGERSVTLAVACPTIVPVPGAALGGVEGSPFGPITFTQTGGVGAVVWSHSGALPSGLTFSAGGVLSGTPDAGSAGEYTVTFTVTDQNLCTGSVPITFRICPVVTVGPAPLAAFLQNVSYGETFVAAGGVAPYTFAVTAGALPAGILLDGATGALSGTPTTLGPFDFTITATDANGCTGSRPYPGRVCPVITVTTDLLNGVVGAAYNQPLAASGSPDTPYTFSLTGGALPDGVNLVAGVLTGTPTTPGNFTFTITATDTNGCTGSRTYEVEVCLAPSITPTPASVCALSTGNTADGPAGATTYLWTIANGTITAGANAQTVTYTAGASGNVTLTLTVTSASSCTASTSVDVPINANPATPAITGIPAGGVCADSTGNTASGPAGATTYAWTITGGTITSATNIQTVTWTAGASGSVNLTLVVTNASGCSATNSASATINPSPATPTITGIPAGGVCADSTGNTASGPAGATTYAWTITGGTITSATNIQTVTWTAGSSGSANLTLVVTNASGCSATNSATATINANPATPAITGIPAGGVCADSTGNTASGPAGATTYAWTITGGTITSATSAQTVTYTAGSSGSVNLTLVVTNASGCSATNSATATIRPNPATPTITGIPAGGVCADSTGNTATGPAGAATYAWTITGGTITSATNLQTVTWTAGSSGSVNLTLVVTNASGCSATNSASATINPSPATPTITGIPAGGVCANSTGNTASGPAGATTYAWSITGGTITSATNIQTVTWTAGASGSVNLTLVVTNASGCSATNSASATINANPATPTITTPTASVCTASPGNTASGPAGATTYAWTITNGTITSAADTQTVTYTAGASGSVQLTIVVTNASGCSATNSLVVPIDPLPTLAPATGTSFTTTFNTPFSQAFTASGGTGPFTYTISPPTPPAGLSFVGGTLSGSPNATGTFTFTVTATSAVGCASTAQSYTLVVRPNLVADSYSGVGNTQLYVTGVAGAPTTPAVASSTTAVANDTPLNNVTVTGVVSPCVGLGGTITIDSAGRFVYTPPVGAAGNDVCTYTATSDTGGTGTAASATATITIGLSNRVWYVNGAAGAGDGRSSSPFNTLASASTAHASNDTVFVQSGGTPTSTPGAITMKATTWLWGQGTALPAVGGITIQNTGATTKPSLTGTVTLGGSSVTVSSLDIATSGAIGLTDDQVGAITGITVQNNVTVSATNAAAVVLSDVTSSASGMLFAGLSSSNSPGAGVSLTNAGGTFTASGGAISDAAGTDFLISGGTADVTFGGTITDDLGVVVAVSDATGGTKTFSGAITDNDDGDGQGVVLTSNTGATISFSGGLVLSTGGSPAFTATGGGTVNVCDESPCDPAATGALANTLTTTTGTALNVANTTIGANDLEFRSVSSNGGSDTGIVLDTTGAIGGLKVKGNGSAGSGGTIANKSGADGSTTTGVGIYLNGTANVSLAWMQLNDFQNSGIVGRSVTGFTLTNSVLNGVIGTSSAPVEGPIMFGLTNPGGANGLQGTGLIRDTKIRGGIEHNVEFYNQSGSMTLTIEGTTAPGTTSGACEIRNNSAAFGSDGVQLEMQGTATANVTIRRCFFDDNKSQPVQAAANDNSAIDIRIEDSVVRRTAQGNEGFVLSNGSNGDLTAHVTGNDISGLGGVSIFVGQTAGNATAGSNLTAVISNNTVTAPASATNHAIIAFLTSTVGQVAPANILISSNTVTQNSTQGVARGILVDTPDANTTPSFTATVTGNTVSVGDGVNGVGPIVVQARRGAGCFDIQNNAATFPNGNSAGIVGVRARQAAPATANLEQGVSGSAVPATVLAANNPATTTEVLGTLTVVGNNTCSPPPP